MAVVGSRIESDSYVGTVRFIGSVPNTKGEWVGIEWDDCNRGKHDGTKDGVRYFSCKHPTGGSFVRPHKINHGISICDAIKERYTEQGSVVSTEETNLFIVVEGGLKKVETVGMEKVQKQFENLHQLKQAAMRDQLISSAGEKDLLLSLTPKLVELDISKNLLPSWKVVYEIANQLPQLKILNLSENHLSLSENLREYVPAFSSLHTLILNKCKLTWNEVIASSVMWPHVQDLHLSSNSISEICPAPDNVFDELEFLNLSGNPIKNWDQMKSFSTLPKLTTLLLNECNLSEMNIHSDEFRKLENISLAGNKFQKLQVFNELNKLPALINLTIRKNPVQDLEDEATMREIIIAKIGRLEMLNRTAVEPAERTGSELDYLRKFGLEWKDSGGDQDPAKNNPSETFIKNHPRFMEIVQEYGAPADTQIVKKSSALKGNLIELTIEAPVNPNFKPVKRRLPLSMTIGNLKLFLQKLTKTEIRKQRLVYVSRNDHEHVVELERDYETLHDVSIEPQDIIQVLEGQPSWRYRREQRAIQAHLKAKKLMESVK
ncbi:tubulin-specific chaperone E-like isoform X2 [Clavelina lepadiformis]|uniref:Tubulin-specific chaperone E n=1 Tax=Clavelina lepadiformis TaxID=159417 RepID=A0ABP0GSZ6_CLALP